MARVISSSTESQSNEGVVIFESAKRLADLGTEKLPTKYILPPAERPGVKNQFCDENRLPVIDLSRLEGSGRGMVIDMIGRACHSFGFFQVINHGISTSLLSNMMKVTTQFFDLPFKEKLKYMSEDFTKPVRYGTSFNQMKDEVFCWRDFLKQNCQPLSEMVHLWPSEPPGYREVVALYAEESRLLAAKLMDIIMETLALPPKYLKKEFEQGTQTMVLNYYPLCPEPDLTLGIPPHSDYGCLTILLQDIVEGLQVHHEGQWKPVKSLADSLVVSIGDHLEILSNGRYKSIMHRVVVNSEKSRVSVATLHSLPFEAKISPAIELIDQDHPKQYNETDFATFLKSMATNDLNPRRHLHCLDHASPKQSPCRPNQTDHNPSHSTQPGLQGILAQMFHPWQASSKTSSSLNSQFRNLCTKSSSNSSFVGVSRYCARYMIMAICSRWLYVASIGSGSIGGVQPRMVERASIVISTESPPEVSADRELSAIRSRMFGCRGLLDFLPWFHFASAGIEIWWVLGVSWFELGSGISI